MPVAFFNRFNDMRRGGIIYPSPFFDIAQTYMPPTVKELFKWCKLYFYTNPVIRPTVVKLAAYPITDLIYTGDEDLVRIWEALLDKQLNIKSHFINCGLDYYAMGNSVTSIFFPFQRWLKCPGCNKEELLNNVKDWSFKDLKWKGICPSCDNIVEFIARDQYVRDWKRLNLVRWSIENIDVDHNEITGTTRYFYTIPQKTKRAILSNKKAVIAETPLSFIQAVKEDKAIELRRDNVFHMQQLTLAEEDQGIGKPAILAAMRSAFYLQLLRKANEAIAFQYIIPLTVLFPAPNTNFDPYRHINLAEWRGRVEDEIMKWKDDCNYIPIMPIPLGYQQLWGNAKALMVTPEVRNIMEEIVISMGVPQEFIFGGMQWSGSTVSLRMIENQMLRHREQMGRMLDFVVDRISRFFHLRKVDTKFADFKMADDIQVKQLMGNLVMGQKLSLQSYIQELGKNLETEQRQIIKELEFTNKLNKMQMIAQAEAQGRAMEISMRYQTKAQLEAQDVQQKEQQKQTIKSLAGAIALQKDQQQEMAAQQAAQAQQAAAQGQPPPQQGAPAQPAQAPQATPQQAQQPQQGAPGGSRGGAPMFRSLPADPNIIARQTALQIGSLDPAEKKRTMEQMQRTMPNLYGLVSAQQKLLEQQHAFMPSEKPLPTVNPPRRAGGGGL